MTPDDFLALAREQAARPDAAERHWRSVALAAQDAVHTLVATSLGLDPAAFSGSARAVTDALFGAPLAALPEFLRLARRHWNTLWLTRLRAERDLKEPLAALDAQLSLALAERIFAARRAGLQ
jgi:hypothetical protein